MGRQIHIIPLLLAALAALIVGGCVAAYILYGGISYSYDDTGIAMPSSSSMPSSLSTSSPPSRLIIPVLNIDTVVEHVGVTKAGLMGNPSNFVNVAWFKYGPAPGDMGSAVIGGHVDNALALDGVFKHLNTLKAGDMIEVKNEAGATLTFRVSAVETYPYQSVPQAIFTKTRGVYLNLITCAGTWQSKQHTYDQRLVVYTELAGVTPR